MASARVEELRREFDAAFAAPVRGEAADTEDLLLIRLGASPYALRVAELGGVSAGHRVTLVPSSHRALLGLVGMRGALVPVFDLARLLGEKAPEQVPRWVAVSQGESPIGLAFAAVDGHLRVAASALETNAVAERTFVEQIVRTDTGLRPVASVASVVKWLREKTGPESLDPGKG